MASDPQEPDKILGRVVSRGQWYLRPGALGVVRGSQGAGYRMSTTLTSTGANNGGQAS
jgi:hypothetical protein